MTAMSDGRAPVPRDPEDDYTRSAADTRHAFLSERTDATFEHVASYSLDPGEMAGNIEQFIGVAQVPLGVAGPLLVNGEHAQGEFYVPLATAEGTLVASYNRGMKLLHAAGGVTTTILDDRMQRAPCFLFASARDPRPRAVIVHALLQPTATALSRRRPSPHHPRPASPRAGQLAHWPARRSPPPRPAQCSHVR